MKVVPLSVRHGVGHFQNDTNMQVNEICDDRKDEGNAELAGKLYV
jgi:hypothetical protein